MPSSPIFVARLVAIPLGGTILDYRGDSPIMADVITDTLDRKIFFSATSSLGS